MLKLFNLSLIFKGFPMKEAKSELSNILALSEENFEKYALKKRNEIVKYHLENNKSYQDFVGNFLLKIGTNCQ
jgi:phenylacetate-CoA ligase